MTPSRTEGWLFGFSSGTGDAFYSSPLISEEIETMASCLTHADNEIDGHFGVCEGMIALS